MAEIEILIRKRLSTVDACASGAVAINEVAALTHETLDHAVEFRAFVSLRTVLAGSGLASAKLAEVLCGSGDGVGEELHFDPAEGFGGESDVEEDDGVGFLWGGGGHGWGLIWWQFRWPPTMSKNRCSRL